MAGRRTSVRKPRDGVEPSPVPEINSKHPRVIFFPAGINGKYSYGYNGQLERVSGFDNPHGQLGINKAGKNSTSRARADATLRRSAAILAPLHSSRDRNTGESSFASVNARFCDRVPPRTRAAGRVSSCQLGDEVVRASCFEMSRETGRGSRRLGGRSEVHIVRSSAASDRSSC